jgi:hypothetical protein
LGAGLSGCSPVEEGLSGAVDLPWPGLAGQVYQDFLRPVPVFLGDGVGWRGEYREDRVDLTGSDALSPAAVPVWGARAGTVLPSSSCVGFMVPGALVRAWVAIGDRKATRSWFEHMFHLG